MIYDIEITDQADKDIREIYEYIAYELQSPENASGQLERIEQCIMSLDSMPERFRIYQKWRKAPCFSYGDISHTLFPVKSRSFIRHLNVA